MDIISELVREELIDLNNDNTNVEDFFRQASDKLIELDYAEDTFFEAIYEREKKYPTGLELPKIVIAIPHTDVDHIKEPFIYVNKMESKSLEFIQMGTDDVSVYPEYVIVLGIKEPEEQVGLLSTLIELFSDAEFVEEFKHIQSEKEMYNLLNE